MTHEFIGEFHLHSDFSDSISSIEENVQRAAQLGYKVLALTDHGTMGGSIRFLNACNDANIKGVVGVESYIRLPQQLAEIKSNNSASGRFHMTLWSSGLQGYNNLIALHNASHRNMEQARGNKYPIITFDMMREYDLSGITVGTGCVASATMHENLEIADTYIQFLINQFGHDYVYAEVQRHNIIKDHCGTTLNSWERPLYFAKEYDLQTIWTNDCHAAYPEQLELLELATKTAKGYSFTACALESKDDIRQIAEEIIGKEETEKAFYGIEKLMKNTEDVDVHRNFELPECDELIDELKAYLLLKLESDIELNGAALGEDVLRERLEKEWDLNERWKFWNYFAVVWDIMRFAHENDVSTNARGSAGGSYILYLLDIIQLHPVKYGLYFERFLCEARMDASELPDVDLDCSSKKRSLVQQYATERWGMIGVGTYLTYSHSSLIRFISRVWGNVRGYPMDSKLVSDTSAYEAYEYDESGVEIGKTETFERFCNYADFIEPMYRTMLHTISGVGRHACALVVADGDVAVPIESFASEPVVAYVTSGKDKSLEYIGRTKLDLLGLTSLDRIDDIRDLIGVEAPREVQKNDSAFQVYNNNALGGLFSFDTSVARLVNSKNAGTIAGLEDLAYQTAVGRTGPMTQGWHLITKVNPLDTSGHPEEIRKIFDKTNGVISTQEQIMELYALVAYGELNAETIQQGVIVLKALVPKSAAIAEESWWKDKYQQLKNKFIEGGVEHHGLGVEYLTELFSSLSGFIRYGLNKSHALSLVGVSARMAWYKHNYPEAYWTITLNDTPNNKEHLDEVIRYFVEATRFGNVTITAPTINTGGEEYTLNMDMKQVQMPLTAIKGLGPKAVHEIFNERTENGLFTSLSNFNERCKLSVNLKKLLYECGVFDDIKSGNVSQDLSDLGVREQREFSVKGKKWESEDVIEIEVTHSEYSEDGTVTLTDELGDEWYIGSHTKTKTRSGLSEGVVLLLIVDEDKMVIEFKKKSYVEPVPEMLPKDKAIRAAYGFAWNDNLIKFYEGMEQEPLSRFFGFVVEIEEERRTPQTTQYSVTLESGKRVWFLKEDRTPKNWLTRESMAKCAQLSEERGQEIRYITPDRIPQLQVGDVIGGLRFISNDKETGEEMSYGQVMKYKVY